jgi:hypothetical protein
MLAKIMQRRELMLIMQIHANSINKFNDMAYMDLYEFLLQRQRLER